LDHVDQRTGTVVVSGPALEAELLVVDDVDALNVVAVPQRFEDAVREPQAEQVENGGSSQEVVDPVDLRFRNEPGQARVEARRTFLVDAEWLLEGELGAVREGDAGESVADQHRDSGRQGEVDGRGAVALAQQPLHLGSQRDVGREVCGGRQELVHAGAGGLGRRKRFLHDRAPLCRREILAPRAHQPQAAVGLLHQELTEGRQEEP
jgi:hypothetical protein